MLDFFFKKPISQHQDTIKITNEIYKKLNSYSNEQLVEQTTKLKIKINSDYTKINQEIIAESFATVKEAIHRATGLVLFDVQLLGGIILNENSIAEMKTGEGKTLVALLPAYLNCLMNQGVHVITVNDYLAERDSILAQKIFSFLDIKVGLITQKTEYIQRKKEYNCHITYITNNELGFDYLKDNMAINRKEIIQRSFYYAIIDEADSILIDEARTPLIISGKKEFSNDLYEKSKIVAEQLNNNKHYNIDEKAKNITLTEYGVSLCENILQINNLYHINTPWIKYIINALKAKELFTINKDYIIKNNQVIIVDEFTGRIMEGRRWSDGIHQAIEAKENIPLEAENKTLASITYQNLFLLYKKLCGMTGTAKTEEKEFLNIYKIPVIAIPSNKKCIRKDLPDLVYRVEYNKWQAIANECWDMYKTGRPTLIGTTSIEKSELLAEMLKKLKIPYKLLNAKPENISKEAEIIAEAGTKYSITISTNMAGRGTDIILGGNAKIIAKLIIKKSIENILNTNHNIKTEKIVYHSETIKENNLKTLINYYKNQTINQYNIVEEIENIVNENLHPIHSIYKELLNIYSQKCAKDKIDILNLGGLYIIGTERHESRRIDNQLRGRAGRQGDKGTSRFFLSLEDNLFRIFGGDNINNLIKQLNINDNIPIESILLNKSLDTAQKKVEAYFYDIRKQLFEYDEVINNQRKAIYTERKKILYSRFTRDCIIEYGEYTINEMINKYYKDNKSIQILHEVLQLLDLNPELYINRLINMSVKELKNFLYEQFRINYDIKEAYLEQLRPGLIRQLEKYYLLQQIDKAWQEHIDKMNLLKEYIGWRSYGQQDPLIEYKNEAFYLFINMITYIRQTVIYMIMRSRLIIDY
uniref:Protein translocase subunit SecA n=1 Tax=Lophocladia kuetzingii TaxID=675577 RepID=A0A1Z1MNA9_9FLOR|nr:preprotein-translocase subunit a [Lophocladia kuetzingii]ARW67587.1 preprotein-translocase subunit a [Lophocladia kuetzingii]